jgi:aryl-alcohol dehydrogenase-like predicted oxidoreductase
MPCIPLVRCKVNILWERHTQGSVMETCRELGITIVPYSALGRSALTGSLSGTPAFGRGDMRTTNPRFSAENLSINLEPVQTLVQVADQKSCRPGQLAPTWLHAQPSGMYRFQARSGLPTRRRTWPRRMWR